VWPLDVVPRNVAENLLNRKGSSGGVGRGFNLGGDHDDEDCSYVEQVRVGGSVGCIGLPAPARIRTGRKELDSQSRLQVTFQCHLLINSSLEGALAQVSRTQADDGSVVRRHRQRLGSQSASCTGLGLRASARPRSGELWPHQFGGRLLRSRHDGPPLQLCVQ